MPVSSYPRFTVEDTGKTQNIQNGLSLMVFNTVSGKYEAATSATFSGGGQATSALQNSQITIALTQKTTLDNILIALNTIIANQTNNTQTMQIVDSSGQSVNVNSNRLAVTI
jgi:hypothetical protein